jgi:hypothetical protein
MQKGTQGVPGLVSKKFNLVQDRDDDSVTGSIKRHLLVFLSLVVILFLAVSLVITTTIAGYARASSIQRQKIADVRATDLVRLATAEAQHAEATATQQAKPTPLPTQTPIPVYAVILQSDADLHSDPDVNSPVQSTWRAGSTAMIAARTSSTDWFKLTTGEWIAANTIKADAVYDSLPIVSR